MRYFMGIDVGTTNSKVGIFDEEFALIKLESVMTPRIEGYRQIYDADNLWQLLKAAAGRLICEYSPVSIGITSMAESGVFVDRDTGECLSGLVAWNDKASVAAFEMLYSEERERERFAKTGLHDSYKYSVYKVLGELGQPDQKSDTLNSGIFLPAASYIGYRMTGRFGMDETLALRTYGFDLVKKEYDTQFLHETGLKSSIFPPVYKTGEPLGNLKQDLRREFHIEAETPPPWRSAANTDLSVSIAGHDHMCAAYAEGVTDEQELFLSLGTTGVMLGSFQERTLNEADFETGYSYGLHVAEGQMTWLGSIQAFGSSIDWMKRIIGCGETGYEEWQRILETKMGKAGDVLFFPYLCGSGAPVLDEKVRGGFLGLQITHDAGDLAHAVNEGLGYEMRMILEHAPQNKVSKIKAVGGGTRNRDLLQILADMLRCEVMITEDEQAALKGAAMAAAKHKIPGEEMGKGIRIKEQFWPDPVRSSRYEEIYRTKYLPLQKVLHSHH